MELLNSDITTASLMLSIGNFADKPYIETSNPAYLACTSLEGMIGTFPFSILNPETNIEITPTSKRYSLSGRPDMTDILYREVNIKVDNLKLSTLLAAVGVRYDLLTDFALDSDTVNAEVYLSGTTVKYSISANSLKQYLSILLDWSSTFYQKQMYCTYRNGGIYVTSRDNIKTTYKASDFAITDLSINTTTIRNMNDSQDTSGNNVTSDYTSKKNEAESENEYLISGTFKFGDASVTYSNGLLTDEVNGDSRTTYTYGMTVSSNNGKYSSILGSYLTKKETINASGDIDQITVEYDHSMWGGQYYIDKETEITYSRNDEGRYLSQRKITTYVPLGNGHWGQRAEITTYDDDGNSSMAVSTAISGGGVGPASVFSIKCAQKGRTSGGIVLPKPDLTLQGKPNTSLSCPITETEQFKEYINLYASMNCKKESTLTATIVSKNVIDVCNSAFEYEGNSYYMTSNSISQSENSFRQRITAVRWHE